MSSSTHHQGVWGGIYRLIASETHIRLTRALYPIDLKRCSGIYDVMCGAREPSSGAAAAMVGCRLFPPRDGCSTKFHVCRRLKKLDQ